MKEYHLFNLRIFGGHLSVRLCFDLCLPFIVHVHGRNQYRWTVQIFPFVFNHYRTGHTTDESFWNWGLFSKKEIWK